MVTSQVLQKTIDELRNITRIDLCYEYRRRAAGIYISRDGTESRQYQLICEFGCRQPGCSGLSLLQSL